VIDGSAWRSRGATTCTGYRPAAGSSRGHDADHAAWRAVVRCLGAGRCGT
jgi:hypothetical protein